MNFAIFKTVVAKQFEKQAKNLSNSKSMREQADQFEREGWDVTDDKRRPLRILGHFSHPLWLALRGVAFAAMGTAGQRCTSLRRLFVHRSGRIPQLLKLRR